MRRTYSSKRKHSSKPLVGLALGSGAARGWAHIGVLRELARMGIEPGIVTGASVGAIDIMQDRITRSRMAGEPPDIHITPRLSHIGLLDFGRADESIEEGRQATRRQREELEALARSLRLDSDPASS